MFIPSHENDQPFLSFFSCAYIYVLGPRFGRVGTLPLTDMGRMKAKLIIIIIIIINGIFIMHLPVVNLPPVACQVGVGPSPSRAANLT